MRRPEEELAQLEATHLRRQLHPQQSPTTVADFSHNDYLGLSQHPALAEALALGAQTHSTGATASRLVSGSQPAHHAAELALAQFKESESALLFPSGYMAALGAVQSLSQRGDLILLDRLAHASLIDGARLSGASLRPFRHNDLDHLQQQLRRAQTRRAADSRVLVIAESVYSMDGDLAPVAELHALCRAHDALLLLDEAHALGVLGPQGRGLAAAAQINHEPDLIQLGTLSKALGLQGGFLAAAQPWIDLILNRARAFIYTTGVLPALAAAAPTALNLLTSDEGEQRRRTLRRHRQRVGETLLGHTAPSAIIALIVGDESQALARSTALRELGLRLPAIRFPTVARGQARLRLSLSARHRDEEIDHLLQALTTSPQPH